ncbi:MAG: hypothetical protein LBV55_03470 [Acholeplasmatales bacterium]|jgi:hypothetical protein|nr:hypothetical protein [Acholeplasmatales bacterium]
MKKHILILLSLFLLIYLIGGILLTSFFVSRRHISPELSKENPKQDIYIFPFYRGDISESIQFYGKYQNQEIVTQEFYSSSKILVNINDSIKVGDLVAENVFSLYNGVVIGIFLISENNYKLTLSCLDGGWVEFLINRDGINPNIFLNMELLISINQDSYSSSISNIESYDDYFKIKTNNILLKHMASTNDLALIYISLVTHFDVLYTNIIYIKPITKNTAYIEIVRNNQKSNILISYFVVNNKFAVITSDNITIYDKILL